MDTKLDAFSDVSLILLQKSHAKALFQLVDNNRDFLRQWLPWVDATVALSDTEAFLEGIVEQYRSGRGPQFAVYWRSRLCGVCGFHAFDKRRAQTGSVGYWLAEEYAGLGIMTQAVKELLEIGFKECRLNRIEIACATGNHRSRAIPQRLGFYYEGVLPERELLNGRRVDHALYTLLLEEYLNTVPHRSSPNPT
ncbi:GNAT family N-acetyltransferase [Marinimicrobium locisalis]|uniref:GNAT family N-acetyltransferase n=1 Tax=Marinimicrobium locisalis TaxID=546022 RepID=UPI003221DA3B